MEATTPAILLLDPAAAEADLDEVLAAVEELLPGAHVTRGSGWAAVPVGDGVRAVDVDRFSNLPSVRRLVEVTTPYRLASRELFTGDTTAAAVHVPVRVRSAREPDLVRVGSRSPIGLIVSSRWAAASESRLQLLAPLLHEAGCRVFHAGQLAMSHERDGSPGLTLGALRRLRDVAHAHGLALCVEVPVAGQIAAAAELADVLQVGSRNMQDFSLLREMGRQDRPVLLRRGAGATVEEFLLAAEYVLLHGNGKVMLCESGIRTFDALHKPRFEINAIPLIKSLSHLPLVADPSQSAPHVGTVPAMAKAAVAAGADGLVLEVGTEAVFDPDGVAITVDGMRSLMAELRPIARAVGRTFATAEPDQPVDAADAAAVLRLTDRTLAQTIEAITEVAPRLDVIAQWRLASPVPSLSPPLSPDGEILARCTSYRIGSVRLSRNLSYVDLGRIDPTLGALLEATHLNLGQLFVDPRIEKLDFEFGTDETAGEMDEVFRRCFPDELDELSPYVWRRYQAAIGGVVTFQVIEALPVRVWDRILNTADAEALV